MNGLRQHERTWKKRRLLPNGGLFPRILPWFPRVKQGWPTAAERVNPHPAVQCSSCGPEVDEIIAQLGHCRGTVRTSLFYRTY